jgi:hypothetical protein
VIRGFLAALPPDFILRASPNFSVTTHSFTLPASNKPITVALVLCIDITFSKSIHNITKWNDLQKKVHENYELDYRENWFTKFWQHYQNSYLGVPTALRSVIIQGI